MRHHVLLRTLLAALSAAACASASSGGLTTAPLVDACPAGRYVAFTIAIDRAATPPVWGVGASGQRLALVWPEGFTLADAGVLDPSGRVVARAGQVIDDAMGGTDANGADVICGIGGQVYTKH